MKKFLSLVLALIMTMSLVTISAGATEYRDLTDKEEIQYAEAVAVLNRIGVITGYEDGSFRPETELTRGAAAKIIVSLMIGPDAASALPNNASPYPDVPAGHTFAGVIGYCKTAGYISGYGDGTFKPANPLTGYAFAKMLLGAIGYKSNIEGFVDTGWTMNVARIGNVAGLFDRLDFDGAGAVTRDEACQLALNTLKATMVDYGGNNTVVSSTGEVLTVQGSKAQYVTSNNRDINANINRRVINAVNNEMTLEFGEEHFKDLRLEHDKYDPAYDIYGHPSNEWSYKKVTIGTFKLPADFTYTDQIVHREATTASKEKALGLRGYDTWSVDHRNNWANWSTASSGINNFASPFADTTQIHINGWRARVGADGKPYTSIAGRADARPANGVTLSEIADLTDNGVTVEVYVCPVDADFITDVVVTRTQLMEIDRVATDYVRLKDIEPDSRDKTLGEITGYNAFAIDATDDNLYSNRRIEDVKDDNYDAYNVLKDMKAGDKVAVIPYTEDDNVSWEVGEAYAPETVSGALTRVDIYNSEAKRDGNAIAITVGGTSYKINEWNEGMIDITANDIKSTRKDVTLLLAKDGTALQVTDVGNAGEWMVVADYWQGTNDAGKVVWYVHGYTIDGTEVDLDLGTIRGAAEKYAPGELVRCQINTSSGGGEYILTKPNNLGSSVKKAGMYHTATTDKRNQTLGAYVDPALDANYTHPWDAVTATSSSFSENARATGTDIDKNWEGIYRVALGYGEDPLAADQAADYNVKKSSQYLLLDGYGVKANGSAANAAGHTNRRFSDPERQLVNPGDTVANPLWGYTWDYQDVDYASGVKFIYVSFDSIGEVESLYISEGKQDVDNEELRAYNTAWRNVGTNNDDFVATTAEAYVNDDGNVAAVVIKTDSADADLSGIRIITKNTGSNNYVKTVTGADATETELLKGKWTEREYVQGPDFKDNKVGIFDKEYDVGDILIGSERNGIFYAREFHGDTYRGNSLDGLWIKGVSKVENTLENTMKDRFSISDSELRTLDGSVLLKAADADTSANAAVQALLDQNTDEVITDRHQAGVILAGSAIVIDVRVGHEGEISKIKDLFDYDLSKVEMKVLLNGKKTDAGFRSAYAIVILDAPAVATEGPSTGMNTFSTVDEVNEALKSGNVTINGNWIKAVTDDFESGETKILRIPAGVKLTVDGNFNAKGLRGIIFGSSTSKLVVNGTLTVADELVDTNANVKANKVVVTEDFTFSGKMEVTTDLDVADAKTMTIAGTVTVGRDLISSDGTAPSGGQVVVLSTSSLHVTRHVGDGTNVVTVTVGNGSASKNGLVTIGGTLKDKAVFEDQNVGASAPTQKIATVEGKLVMGGESKLTTETFTPAEIDLEEGATIILEKGTANSDVTFTNADGDPLTTGSDTTKIVVGEGGATGSAEDGTITVPGTVTAGDKPAAPAASVKLGKEVAKDVKVMANGIELTTTAQDIPAGEITLTATGLAEGQVPTFTVATADVANDKFTAVAGETYTVTLVPKTKVTVAIATPEKLVAGEKLPAGGTETVTPNDAASAVEVAYTWKKGTEAANVGDTIAAGVSYTLTATITVSGDVYILDGETTITKTYTVEAGTTPEPGTPGTPAAVTISKGELVTGLTHGATGLPTTLAGFTLTTSPAEAASALELTVDGVTWEKDGKAVTAASEVLAKGAEYTATFTVQVKASEADNYTLADGSVTVTATVGAATISAVAAEAGAGTTISAAGLSGYADLPAATAFQIKEATVGDKADAAAKNEVVITEISKWEYKTSTGSYAEVTDTDWDTTVTNPAAGDSFKATLSVGIKATNDGGTGNYALAQGLTTTTVEITVAD